MSTTTTNFGITLPEGVDTFNPLTFNNDAFALVDSLLRTTKNATIGTANHMLSENINTITRSDSNTSTFTFIASSDYEATQSFRVDGVPVVLRYADGTALKNGAYRTNQVVLCCLNGNVLNIISARTQAADDTSYSNTTSGLSSTNVQNAIDEVNDKIPDVRDSTSYFDIGNIRVCFGYARFVNRNSDRYIYQSIALPAMYANSEYACLITPDYGITHSKYLATVARVANVNTNRFEARLMSESGIFTEANFNASPIYFRWVTIGLKA